MKTTVSNIFLILIFAITALSTTSCSKIVADEDLTGNEVDENAPKGTLNITAASRADGEEETTISYPINVYVFNAAGSCVDVSTISGADDQLSLKLPKGTYDICAVAGAGSDYVLPEKATAKPTSEVTLNDGKAHGDLMTARYSLILSTDESNLSLTLSRKVLMLQSVSLKNIPDDVEQLSVTLSPFHGDLLLDGTYSDAETPITVELTKSSTAGEWNSTTPIYTLPSAGEPTITVSMKRGGATTSTAYTYKMTSAMVANMKYNISGTYAGDQLNIIGTMQGVAWDGTQTIEFQYGDENKTDATTDNNNSADATESEPSAADIPAVGTLYKGAYVLKTETVDGKTTLTLMSLKRNNGWKFGDGKVDAMTKEVNSKLETLGSREVSGWRLGTKDEILLACNSADEINTNFEKLSAVDYDPFNLKSSTNNCKYFFNDNGAIAAYNTLGEVIEASNIKGGTTLLLRAFATVTLE